MLYLIHGSNQVAGRKKLHAILNPVLEKNPDTPVDFFDAETLLPEELPTLIAGQGLFTGTRALVFDRVLDSAETRDRTLLFLTEMGASRNTILFLDADTDAQTVKKFEKAGAEIFHLQATTASPTFNVFALTDAFGRRDRKRLWIEFRKAVSREGNDDGFFMYVNSMLFWQVKSMLLALLSKNPTEAGMKPFTYQKAKTFLKNYTKEELEKLSSKLMELPHDAHRGIGDLEIGLERLVLDI